MSSSGSYKRWLETAAMRSWARNEGGPLTHLPPGLHSPERADLQGEITTLLEKVDAIEMSPKGCDEQDSLELMIAKLAATLAPIRLTPPEVLQHILSFLHFQIPRDIQKISNLMRVCHLWKHAVLNVPSLWNTIAVADHLIGFWNSDYLSAWLLRSANFPLHVSVDLEYLPATCIPALTQVADRWTSFKLTSDGTGSSELMFVSALGRASRLKELHLSLVHLLTRRDPQSQALSLAIRSNVYPTVSHANFLGITGPQATMQQLAHLAIDYCVFGIYDLWELCRSSPLLEELVLSRVSCTCVDCHQVMAANCTLPNLRKMVYIGHGRTLCNYMLSQYTATLESLELDIRAFHSSLWEPFSRLRRLHLVVQVEGTSFMSLFPTYIYTPSWWLSMPCLEEIFLDGAYRHRVPTTGSGQSLVIYIITRLVRTLFEAHSGQAASKINHLRTLSVASTTQKTFFNIVSAMEQWARHYTHSPAGPRTQEDIHRAQERLAGMQHPLVSTIKVYSASGLRAEAQLNLLESTPSEITDFLSIFSSIS